MRVRVSDLRVQLATVQIKELALNGFGALGTAGQECLARTVGMEHARVPLIVLLHNVASCTHTHTERQTHRLRNNR